MLFTVIKFDKALNLAVIEPRATDVGQNTTVWADNIVNKFTHPDVAERIDARFQLLIDTLEKSIATVDNADKIVTEDDGEI